MTASDPDRSDQLGPPAPPDRRTRVLVVGSGPAGLAAAARVLERGGPDRFRVRIASFGHHVGGKAASWRDAEGRIIDHGLHVTPGFYREMKALLRRAGVDVEAALWSNRGHTLVYERRDGRVHDLALRRNPLHVLFSTVVYSGFSAAEKAAVTRFVLGSLSSWLGTEDIERCDDICFSAWCLANGLPPSVVRTNAFRMSRQAQLNWPGEISAYSMLKAIRVIARDYRTSEYGFCDGGMTDRFWLPLVRHIVGMGGALEPMRQLTALRLDGDRVSGALFAEPDSQDHDKPERPRGLSAYEGPVPSKPGSERLDTDFDSIISSIPVAAFHQLNRGDATFWRIPEFARLRELRSVAPLALQIWHRERVTVEHPSVIAGLDGPLPFVLDTKHVIREYRHNPRYGAVLYFVGQEAEYESWSDERLLDLCLREIARLPGFERITRTGMLHYQVVRNRGPHQQYFLTDPGTLKYRPHHRTSLRNLFLCGDWVRSELDFPCMEAAVRSGFDAADALVEAAR